ncbi:PadR family transcriptional regulator [Bacillus licheniformis]|uniref:PadR family transcriptional regulator n=1 Tax=Bacillus licheniformis TaxID=1402 RepID=UPI0034A03CC0
MTKRNHTTYALLGLITAGYRTGYEMKRMINQSLNHFWKISYGQIYPALRQLTEAGWAAASPALSDKKQDRKEYMITAEGQKALQSWLEEPINDIASEKNEFLLKLFFSKEESREKTALKVKEYQQKLEERLEAYKAIEQSILSCSSHSKDREYWLFTLDYGKRTTSAGIEWCEATINRLNGKEGTNG